MLIFYDLETTGLNQFHDKITEFCFIKRGHGDIETFHHLVNPLKPIPAIVQKITQITPELVKNEPTFDHFAQEIINFITSSRVDYPDEPIFLVAHNNDGFDQLVLNAHLKSCGITLKDYNLHFIDSLLLSRKLHPEIPKHNLSALNKAFNLPWIQAHRADGDCNMLANVYNKLVENLAMFLGKSHMDLMTNPQQVYNWIYY